MSKLLYKEYMLAVNPMRFIFILMGAMVLIPSYCYYAVFIYILFVVVNNVFTGGKANKDIEYTVLLPVKKRDVVKARFMSVVVFELVCVLATAVFAVIAYLIDVPGTNMAGIDANPAFFGLSLLMLGGYNFIYMTAFYKTGYKILKPLILSAVFVTLFIGVAESAAQYIASPLSAYLDTTEPVGMLLQLPVLFAGLLLFALLNVWGYLISAKRFERLDL